jgi:uncharacterized integral membrane protein
MNNSDRIAIINSYKECRKDSTDATDVRIIMTIKHYKLWLSGLILNILILCIAVINDLFNLQLVATWQKIGVFFVLSLTNLRVLFPTTFKRTLLNHLKFLENHDVPVNQKNNTDLSLLIEKLNGTKGQLGLIIFAGILLVLFVCTLFIEDAFIVWNYAKIPVCLFYVYCGYYVYSTNNKLKQNIAFTEAAVRK